MPGPAEARVQFARVEPVSISPADIADALVAAIVPGTAHTRYERLWRMGQYEVEDEYLYGRIGFQGAGVTELWNDEINDFEETQLPAGTTAPFALHLDSGHLAFQRRASKGIRAKSFVGAFQALLNEASDFTSWRVYLQTRTVEWADWVQSVERVTRLGFRLLRPNPDYRDREKVGEILEGANAGLADIVLQADEEALDGLDLSDETVSQFIQHADRYGNFKAQGERAGEAEPVVWKSDQEVPQRTIPADPETGEASHQGLRRELDDRPGAEHEDGSE